MKKLLLALLAATMLYLVSSQANAGIMAPKANVMYLCSDGATEGPYIGNWTWNVCDNYNVIDGVDASDTDADNLTVVADVRGYSRLVQTISVLDANASGARIDINCYGSQDEGTIYGQEQSKSISAGVGTLSNYVEQKTLSSGTTSFITPFSVKGYSHFKCIYDFSSGTPTSADKLTVQWMKVIGE